jgi:hypothetical protein
MKGWIYILGNKSIPGLLKIGMTSRAPEERARELSASTGVAEPFDVLSVVKVNNIRDAEKLAHQLFEAYRHNSNREFFNLELDLAIDILNVIAKRFETDDKELSSEYLSLKQGLSVKPRSLKEKRPTRKQRKLQQIREKNKNREKENKVEVSKNRTPSHAEISKIESERKAKKIEKRKKFRR